MIIVSIFETQTRERNSLVDKPEEKERIKTAIIARYNSHVKNLQVSFSQNDVILEGVTRTYYQKQLVQHTAMGLTRMSILNKIEVNKTE
jgi:osmotically-inducible protein OsmY